MAEICLYSVHYSKNNFDTICGYDDVWNVSKYCMCKYALLNQEERCT